MPLRRGGAQHRLNLQGAQLPQKQEQTQRHRGVPNASNHECFAGRLAICWIPIPESHEQVGAGTYAFPAQVEQQQVICHDQQQHRRDEQVHISEVPCERVVVPHELHGVQVDEKSYARDNRHHHDGQAVYVKCNVGLQDADLKPGPQSQALDFAGCQEGARRQCYAQGCQAH